MPLVLAGGTVVDGTGADPVDGATLTIKDGTIAKVGAKAPKGALDVGGLTVLPGLIDAHVHLGLSWDLKASVQYDLSIVDMAAAMFENCQQTLHAGFTTVRDTGGIDRGIIDATAAGKVVGPRILASGPILCQTGGHGHLANTWEPSCAWSSHDLPGLISLPTLTDGVDEMRKNAREAFRRGASFLKLCVTGGVVSLHDKLTDTQFSVEEVATAVFEAKARGSYVTVHAHNNEGIRNAIEAGVACVEHGSGLDEATAKLMAKHNVALVPTLAVEHTLAANTEALGLPPEIRERIKAIEQQTAAAIKHAVKAGVRVGSGSDLIGPDQSYRGLELVLKSEILDPMAALVSATKTNADILGLGDTLGTLEAGKTADIIAIDGNPLDKPELFNDPARIVLVIKDGKIVKDLR